MKKRTLIFARKSLALALGLLMLLSACVLGITAANENFVLSENFAVGTKVSANNAYSAKPASATNDESYESYWRTLSSCSDGFAYLIVPFKKASDINFIHAMLYKPENMATVKLQYTTDPSPTSASNWVDIEVLEGDKITPKIAIDFDTVTATGIRFYTDVSTHYVGLYEIEAYYTNDPVRAAEELNFVKKIEFKDVTQPKIVDAKIVSVGENGELIYSDFDGKGGKLLDFSYVGYKRGEEPIPDVKVVKTIEASYRDNHTSLIQDAINEVAALPLEQRGAILLKAGTYNVSDTIKINASGIVLRGEGQGENGTVIYDTRKSQVTTMQIRGSGAYTTVAGTKSTLASDYVPVGNTEFELSAVDAYNVGDCVKVVCTPNDLWVKTLGMDVIPGEGSVQWKANEYVMTYERVVTAVDAAKKSITIDTGIPLTLDKTYYSVSVEKIKDSAGRITECGIENIRFISYYDESIKDESGRYVDENHGWIAVSTSNCRNCWVRDITAKHYGTTAVQAGSNTINATIDGCSYLEPVSIVEGVRRYSFNMSSCAYVLFKNCYSYDSRHDYVLNSRVEGPNVFLDSIAEDSNNGSEPHHRWSTGTLFDNIYETGANRMGYLLAINAGNNGSGHGWMGTHTIFWNCLSPAIIVGKPQTEQNFAVGVYGLYNIKTGDKNTYINKRYNKFTTPTIPTPNYPKTQVFEGSPMHGTGYIESAYNPVNPSSLYKAQLSYRLYGDATKNIIPGAPLLNYPATDAKFENYSVTFSGVADQNAGKVFVWVDGEKHEAKFAEDGSNDYSLTLDLENGYHDVYVTQRIDGIESARNAVRTIYVDSKTPYVPEADDKQETTKPADTTDPNEGTGDNTGDSEGKSNNLVLPIAIIVGCVVACVVVFFVVKKTKKSK